MMIKGKYKTYRKTSGAQYNCSLPAVQCQTLSPHPNQPPFQVTLPVYILGMMFCDVEYPFG